LRISGSLVVMLTRLSHEYEHIFHDTGVGPVESLDNFSRNCNMQRRKIAEKL